ncbi:MAG: glycosyltransferase family 2 protein [Duncaniella sp.]|uniref:glycosyltransferase family 2 protein n=1 Tax=Duncaniella sp. TaxID=2518496 RepID=UPI0023C4C510|nr:glycosyltransferase family 2 protein [Duncaniella sp.]MDE5988833.1 glycosyltransferase family 2 protein [Duncaniella sp.]
MSTSSTKHPSVSIIMPVYNAEKFLNDSVGSVLRQTEIDFELICFNDASTDGSLALLKELADKDFARTGILGHMRVIDSPVNIKQGGGRNRALREARGEYVMFVDADDALREDAVETCLKTAKKENADMVIFDYARFTSSPTNLGERICQLADDAAGLRGEELRRRVMQRSTPVWSAMYRKELITANNLFFPEKVFYEDNAVALAIQLSAQNPVKINEALYLYRFDNASVTRSTNNYRFFDRLSSAVMLMENLKRLGLYERNKDELDFIFINQYFTHSIFGCIYRFDRVPMLRHNYIRKTISRHLPDYRSNPHYKARPLKLRFKIWTHVRFPQVIKLLSDLSRRLRG